MIKTKNLELGLEFSLRLNFFNFVLNSPPLTRDVTCSVTLLGRKIYEEAMSDNTLIKNVILIFLSIFSKKENG